MRDKLVHCEDVSLKALACDCFQRDRRNIRNTAESLARVYILDMHLHRRDADSLERIGNGDAFMRISRGIYDYAVRISVGALNLVHDIALVV